VKEKYYIMVDKQFKRTGRLKELICGEGRRCIWEEMENGSG
jgi:hypothetical protein